jgi:enoyl-CoA hydratase
MSYHLPAEVTVTGEGSTRVVTLNRPSRMNAVNAGLHEGLAAVWRQIAADEDARAVVLTGAGKAFCAGGDMDFFAAVQRDVGMRTRLLREAKEIMLEMVRFPLPVVAAINGPAVGLGCSLAVLCDVVLMEQSAYIADPHVGVGLVAGDGGAATWPLFISLLKAKEYLLTGDRIPADVAERIGLANRVVGDGQSLKEALALAGRLAEQPPFALQATKRALNIHLEQAIAGVADFALAAESECFTLPEHQQKVAEFLAK